MLQQNDIEVILVCKTPPKKNFAKHILVNAFDYNALYSLCRNLSPDYIVCFSEDLFIDIAVIRKKLKIQGMDISKSKLLSHKNLMYKKLDDRFPYPKTIEIDVASNFYSLQQELNTKEIFIKPINKAGSYETYHIKTDFEYQQFLLKKKENFNNYIAQAYINGELYHSEVIIYNKEILFCSARKYSYPNHLMVSKNVPIFSLNISNPKEHKMIKDASIKVTRLLEINNGILHSEFFMNKEGNINFIETNARAPGIGLNRMYLNKLFISFETLLCLIVCGKNPPTFKEKMDLYICGYYPLKPGIVKSVVKPKLEIEHQWIIYVKPDDINKKVEYMSKSAMFICWDKCIKKLDKAIHILANHEVVEVAEL